MSALGWQKNIVLEEKEIQLQRGDRLLLYTDGIVECRNHENEEFSIERFMDFISSNIKNEPKIFSENLLKHLREFSGEEKFDDDLCLVVLDAL